MAFSWQVQTENQTHDVAADLAAFFKAQSKPVFLSLHGQLGMGKTSFARAFIRRFVGQSDLAIASPSFTLLQEYNVPNSAQKIRHYDLYRLEEEEELYELDWDDALYHDICLVEWPERAGTLHPQSYISILFELGEGEQDAARMITIEAHGHFKDAEDEIIKLLDTRGERR